MKKEKEQPKHAANLCTYGTFLRKDFSFFVEIFSGILNNLNLADRWRTSI